MGLFSKKSNLPHFRFYVIDDDEDIREAVCAFIQVSFDAEIQEFCSLDEVTKELDKQSVKPDMIICDVKMPGLSGFAINGILEERDFHIPVIHMTGLPESSEDEDDEGLIILTKPFSKDQLIETITAVYNERILNHKM